MKIHRRLINIIFIAVTCFWNTQQGSQLGIVITPTTPASTITSYTQSFNQAGLLNKAFGSNGTTTTSINGNTNSSYAYACALQPDGKIIAAGYSNIGGGVNAFALARYTTNGALDTTFGTNGIVTTNISGVDDRAYACALQSDGKIIAVGYSAAPGGGNPHRFALVRYTTTGTVDTTFGNRGIVTTSINGNNDQANACVIQPDGKIIAAGYTDAGGPWAFALVRYTATGALDISFGLNNNGIVTTNINGTADVITACILQPDGKIVTTGHTELAGGDEVFATVRYTTNGVQDTTFGIAGTGIVQTAIGTNHTSNANACSLQPDGKIITAGYTNNGAADLFALIRYTTEGIIDQTFGTNGIVTTSLGGSNAVCYACALQPDGAIIAAGIYRAVAFTPPLLFALTRYTANGALDLTFGTNGIVTNRVSNFTDDEIHACVLQSDGKIMSVGYTDIAGGAGPYAFALARYMNPFTLQSFSAVYGSAGLL